jgi:phospholipid transport system substrate-binding protein
MKQQVILRILWLLILCMSLATRVHAQDVNVEEISRSDPEKMIEQTTRKVLELSKEAQSNAQQNPERIYKSVAAILEHVVDAHYVSRSIMGTYGSSRLYRSLETDEEKAAFRERVERFAQKMEDMFITSYADALFKIDPEDVSVSHETLEAKGGTVTVRQRISGAGRQPYYVDYRLHRGKDGNWSVFNVIVEGLNVGQLYRNQFAEMVQRNRRDVDYVVNNWERLMDYHNPLPEPGDEQQES